MRPYVLYRCSENGEAVYASLLPCNPDFDKELFRQKERACRHHDAEVARRMYTPSPFWFEVRSFETGETVFSTKEGQIQLIAN